MNREAAKEALRVGLGLVPSFLKYGVAWYRYPAPPPTWLGSGCQGAVFQVGQCAVKVCRPGPDGKLFYKRVRTKRLRSEHYPEIHALGRKGDVYVVVMELLKPCPKDIYTRKVLPAYEAMRYGAFLPRNCEGVSEAFFQLRQQGLLYDDVHDGNVMLRGNTPVLTDVCF